MDHSFEIRPLDQTQSAFQLEMFFESLFVVPGDPPFQQEIIQQPGLLKYWQNWGTGCDLGFMAVAEDTALGACWTRYSTAEDPGYGFVSSAIPELGIAVRKDFRGQGIGSALLAEIIHKLRGKGVPGISLSADVRNQAINLYTKTGFNIVRQDGNSLVMLLEFS